MNYDPNIIYQSNNYGPYRIVKKLGYDRESDHSKAEIEFINTGYKTIADITNILHGNVKDATINPLNDISHFDEKRKQEFIYYKLRTMHKDMIRRCTNKNHKEYYAYGEAGITISDDWLNSFDTFYNDCTKLFQFDKFYNFPYQYQLDKDYKQMNLPKNPRIYSKETCIFLSKRDNKNLSIIDRNKNRILTSRYYGVSKVNSWYLMKLVINGYKIEIRFSNEIAAANAFNYFFEYYHNYDLIPLHNDVPYMPQEEWNTYIAFPKLVCKVI